MSRLILKSVLILKFRKIKLKEIILLKKSKPSKRSCWRRSKIPLNQFLASTARREMFLTLCDYMLRDYMSLAVRHIVE